MGEMQTEDLKDNLATLKAELELSANANSGVVEQYERRAREASELLRFNFRVGH